MFVLLRETERLWENWLITKTEFPSPRCDMSCSCPVGAARSHCTRERRERQNWLNEVSSRFTPCRDYEERFRCSDFDLFHAKMFGL